MLAGARALLAAQGAGAAEAIRTLLDRTEVLAREIAALLPH